jgi:hypothetical protein
MKDFKELPKYMTDDMTVYFVKHFDEVYRIAFGDKDAFKNDNGVSSNSMYVNHTSTGQDSVCLVMPKLSKEELEKESPPVPKKDKKIDPASTDTGKCSEEAIVPSSDIPSDK